MIMQIPQKKMAKMIDHTLLKPTATREDIIKLCSEAREYSFAAVCINPFYVQLAAKNLKDSGVLVCTVIGFPLGSASMASKAFEAAEAVKNGAREVDMVINIGALKEGREGVVLEDIRAVVEAVRSQEADAVTKVIIETGYLTREEKIMACRLAGQAGAHYVKTSTGFGPGGATVEDVMLMRETVGPSMGVKASGGIKNVQQALAMIEAGATRIGASAGVEIIRNL
ncbi:deoxyribose-phosphate aldolase [Desulfoscipio geothermicus DSM 3669]|uniref:Deoxyribose-phosphate aldolase n=2 Tax=Desulfoscipio geothermicus TaxID=39060 RepID=A0A1I6DY81_9FIRM|nr:deoxyribose-phosphate aldolase [Desulfoscipio geothermicus DSM 3669]